ncbi:hypothetical protein [Thalassoroseus pseudoceratinae]|uniref:hypothetical protein n=1 Tax=Thalassoroseus pseudoceratinae TaxID=2713176 RepID=UPI00141DB047|nr:hypothetical protein [Thalassoroseus pseudoceratinae]
MRFALVGDDPAMLPLVQAIGDSERHELTHATLSGDITTDLLQLVPQVKIVDDWSELLVLKELDTVLVGGSAASVLEAARRLAGEGISMMVFPCVAYGEGLAYELALIRDEHGATILPAVPLAIHPATIAIHGQIEDARNPDANVDDVPKIREIRLRRRINTGNANRMTRSDLESSLLSDLCILGGLSKTYHRITAILTGSTEDSLSTATVTLNGSGLPDAVWTCETADHDRRDLTFVLNEDEQRYSSGETLDELVLENASESYAQRPAGQSLLKAIEHPNQPRRTSAGTAIQAFNWTNLVRAYEQLHAVRKSIRKGRTIELHFEDTSERSQFKSQMTAIGCGVLTLTFFGVLAYLGVAAVFDNRTGIEKRAEVRNAILYQDRFQAEQPSLTRVGQEQLDSLIESRSFPIVIEATEVATLDSARKERVSEKLDNANIENPTTQIEVLPIAGPTLATILKVTRILVFLPLFLFLLSQILLVITKPSQS